MKNLLSLLFAAIIAISCQGPQITDESIDKAIAEGNFTVAEQMIKLKTATENLTPGQKWELDAKIQKMQRTRGEFTKDDTTVLAYIKNIIPDVTQEQIARWESTGALECLKIDGVKKYFYGAARNLFRIDKEAKAHWEKANGIQPGDLDEFFSTHIPAVVAQTKKGQIEHLSKPQKMRITYTITVKPNEVPEGEMIRVWMPFPRENKRSSNIKLLSTSHKNHIIGRWLS